VNKRRFIGVLLFAFLITPALTIALDKGIVKFQGVVMAIDLKQGTIVVNERLFFLDAHTMIHNEKGTSIPLEKLRLRDWVYLEGVSDRGSRRNLAKKIYFLLRYVDEKQKHLYPFME